MSLFFSKPKRRKRRNPSRPYGPHYEAAYTAWKVLKRYLSRVGLAPSTYEYVGEWRYTEPNESFVSTVGYIHPFDILVSYFPKTKEIDVSFWEFGKGGQGEGEKAQPGSVFPLHLTEKSTLAGAKKIADEISLIARDYDELEWEDYE